MPIWLTLLAAVVALLVVLVIGSVLIQPPRSLLVGAGFSPETISPNADGIDDVTQFDYEISEAARVSLAFESEKGEVYFFRESEPRAAGEYSVLFSGVVDGFSLPDDEVFGEILRRLIPNGVYSWHFTVEAQDSGETAFASGTLVIENGDSPLPEMAEFTVSPEVFTPNQDGIADRVMINIFTTKDAELDVYLVNAEGERLPIARREEGRLDGEAGRHIYDYEGGVDIGADPPPDGSYMVVAEARDTEGQITQRRAELTIINGGKPRAEIIGQPTGATVVFDVYEYSDETADFVAPPDDPESVNFLPITMPLDDILVFKLTIENYGVAPIRTSGPPPGTVYEQTELSSSFGEYEQSGVWRVGIQCETSEESYPWRWAIGTDDDLYTETDPTTGNSYSYLAPGERAVVWGGIRMTELIPTANPQACWAGLIHEDVEITLQNNNVGRREIELADLTGSTDNERQ